MNKAKLAKDKLDWQEYLSLEDEPKVQRYYEISPEFAEEVLDHSPFLKMRVRRNMRRVMRQYRVPRYEYAHRHKHGRFLSIHHMRVA